MPGHEGSDDFDPETVLPPEAVAGVARTFGAAAYRWTPDDDLVRWSAASEAVLGRERLPLARRGADYARLIEPGSGQIDFGFSRPSTATAPRRRR